MHPLGAARPGTGGGGGPDVDDPVPHGQGGGGIPVTLAGPVRRLADVVQQLGHDGAAQGVHLGPGPWPGWRSARLACPWHGSLGRRSMPYIGERIQAMTAACFRPRDGRAITGRSCNDPSLKGRRRTISAGIPELSRMIRLQLPPRRSPCRGHRAGARPGPGAGGCRVFVRQPRCQHLQRAAVHQHRAVRARRCSRSYTPRAIDGAQLRARRFARLCAGPRRVHLGAARRAGRRRDRRHAVRPRHVRRHRRRRQHLRPADPVRHPVLRRPLDRPAGHGPAADDGRRRARCRRDVRGRLHARGARPVRPPRRRSPSRPRTTSSSSSC